jgi:tetratricopeptide (TPR) repeat protein
MTRPQEPRRRRRTQFRVPPPLTQRVGATGFPGLDLLEHEAPPAGVVIWRCFRDVELWARTPHRAGLFAGGGAEERARDVEALDADAYGGALPPLRVLAGVAACPERAVPEEVAGACARLAGWFEGQGRLRSAIEFAQAASFVEPGRAIPAVRVGRLARMLAEYPRAIGWFDHAIYLARRSSDWQAYAEALAGLGILYAQLGNLPRARAYHARCLRVSRRSHLREMAGAAYHNLFTLETDAGNYELAEAHVARAFQAYPATAPGLPRLARDVAWQWTVMGYFARALPLAMEALHHFSGAVERALVWANIARAAGGAGEGDVFEDAWAETWFLVNQGVTEPFAAGIMLDLAHGAASLRETARAARAAGKALDLARLRREGKTLLEAEALLDSLHPGAAGPPTEPSHAEGPPSVRQLGDEMVRVLRLARAAAT